MSGNTDGRSDINGANGVLPPADFDYAVNDEFDQEQSVDPGEIEQYLADLNAQASGRAKKDDQLSPEDEMLAEIVEMTLEQEVDCFPWRMPSLSFGLDNRYSNSKILELDSADGCPSIIGRMASQVSEIVQFPGNTSYLHGLGAFSSACVINFEVEYNSGFVPVGLYTLGAQPSGSGKSAIDDFFVKPIAYALKKRNRTISMLHKNIDSEMEEIAKKADKAKNDIGMLREYSKAMQDLIDQKMKQPLVDAPIKNTTPQAAEMVAAKQGGVINVVSDEAEALDTYLGISYTDAKKNPDHGVFMAAFGGNRLATARVGRESVNLHARGAFAVIAQNPSVDTMIKAGATGRGVSERCLIIKEPSLIGYRTYSRQRRNLDLALKDEYLALCESVVNGNYPIQLTMSEECLDMLVDLKNLIEPQCRSGSKYGDEQIKGFASKIEQHVTKMAAIFHICEQWNPKVTSRPQREIQAASLTKSMLVCMDLLDSYRTLIESASTMGGSKLVLEVIGVMKRYATKGHKFFTVDKLRMAVHKEPWFLAAEGKKVDFLVNLLLRAEEMNFCHVKEGGKDKKKWPVLINPMLRDFVVKSEE